MSNPCAICLEAISTTTGMTTLACSHSFHFRCIASWILAHDTCPCCRSKLGDLEKLPNLGVPEDEVHIEIHDVDPFGDDDEFGDDSDEEYSEEFALDIQRQILPTEQWVKINGQWVVGVQLPS